MAEQITIGKIDIDYKSAVTDTEKLKSEVVRLRDELKQIKKTTGETSSEYIKYNAELKANQEQLRKSEKVLSNVVSEQNLELGTIERLTKQNAILRAEQRKLDLTKKQDIKRNKQLNKEIDKNTAVIKGNVDQRQKEILNIGNYPGAFGAAATAASKFCRCFLQ